MDTHMIVTVIIHYLWHGVQGFQLMYQLEDRFLSAVCDRLFNVSQLPPTFEECLFNL